MSHSQKPIERASELADKYPELGWMVGQDTHATPENSVVHAGSTVGAALFPDADKASLAEFDRAYVGVAAMDWVRAGDRDSLTACQAPATRLSQESFDALQAHTREVLPDETAVTAMETFIAINDLGKIGSFARQVEQMPGAPDTVDHDVVMQYGLQQSPELSPSFAALPETYRTRIVEGMGTNASLAQFMQAESIPASIAGLGDVDPKTRDFYLLHSLYDIAGAAGQAVQNGSVVLTEPTARNYQYAREALDGIGEDKSAAAAYQQYLGKKAEEFDIDMSTPDDVAVTRLATMLRMSTPEQAAKVRGVYDGLPANTRAILGKELSKSGTDDGIASIIYYSPALLANLQKEAGSDPDKWQDNMTRGFTTLARVYQAGRTRGVVTGSTENGVQTVLISQLAQTAATEPSLLDRSKIRLDGEGLDVTASLQPVTPIDLEQFPRLTDLSGLPGERFAVIGMGGGSDGVQAAIFSQLLEGAGKECPAVVSIRADKPTSQGIDGQMPERRTVQDHGGQVVDGVYLVTPATRGSGRFLEHLPAAEVPMYLVGDDELTSVTGKLQAVLDDVGGVDTVIGLDTGGDVLYTTTGHEVATTTPDQDVRSLQAIKALGGVASYCAVVAAGIDSPDDAESVLQRNGAVYYEPTPEQSEGILATYRRWGMDGSDDCYFGKTPLAWQAALKSDEPEGVVTLDLPESVVTSDTNPWNPYVNIQPATRGAFLIELSRAEDM